MVSRRERLDLAARISGVEKGRKAGAGHEKVRSGACLSIRSVRVESKTKE